MSCSGIVGGYLGEEKRFFGGCDEVGDVVGCFWKRGDEDRGGGFSHRDFFFFACRGGCLSLLKLLCLADYQVPIHQRPPIVAGS